MVLSLQIGVDKSVVVQVGLRKVQQYSFQGQLLR